MNSETKRPVVLLVEDDEPTLLMLKEVCRQEGYDVIAHSDPEMALQEVRNREIDIVLADFRMPKMDGLELLDRIRKLQPHASRILISGAIDWDTTLDALRTGKIHKYILKPWIPEELLIAIRSAIDSAALRVQLYDLQTRIEELERRLKETENVALEASKLAAEKEKVFSKTLEWTIDQILLMLKEYLSPLWNATIRTSKICSAMAIEAGLDISQRRLLELAAQLYDIGMIGIPISIIEKWWENPNQLKNWELSLIKQHPIVGERLSMFVEKWGIKGIGSIIRSHHERLDGSGFPDGLKGSEIPRLAKFLAVASTFGESSLGDRATISYINSTKGVLFDEDVVNIFNSVIPRIVVPPRERLLRIRELRPGMIAAKGIYSANGTLVVGEGQLLTETVINNIKQLYDGKEDEPLLGVYC